MLARKFERLLIQGGVALGQSVEVDHPGVGVFPDHIGGIDPWPEHIGIRTLVRVACLLQPRARRCAGDIEGAVFFDAFKAGAGILGEALGGGQVNQGAVGACGRQVRVNARRLRAVQSRCLGCMAKRYQRHAHRCAIVHPGFIAPGFVNARGLGNGIQHHPVLAAADRVGGHQARSAKAVCLDGMPRFLEPVAHQIGAAGHAALVGFPQRFGVGVTQLGAHFFVAQERRVANDHTGFGPWGLRRMAFSGFLAGFRCAGFGRLSPNGGVAVFVLARLCPAQQRVPALDMVERLQHWVGLELVAMGQAPLQLSYPYRYAGQLGSVFVQLYAQHVVRAGYQVGFTVQAQRGGVQVALVLDVFERLEPEKQEVAAAAGGVEHAVALEHIQPMQKQRLRFLKRGISDAALDAPTAGVMGRLLLALAHRHEFRNLPGQLLPVLQQGLAQYRLHDAQYGRRVGVVGAELAAFGRVQPALKQGAEYRYIDGAPVQCGGVAQLGHVHNLELGHVYGFEQAAVEPRNVVGAKHAAALHGGKQVAQALGEFVAGNAAVVHQPLEHALGQQAHVFGEEAEQALRQKMRDLVGAMLAGLRVVTCACTALAQAVGQVGKTARCGLGDVAVGYIGLEAPGRGPDAPQQCDFLGLVQLVQTHAMGLARVAGELRMDAQGQPVRHHEDGRVGQCQAVGEQLLERSVQIFARGLVLPREYAAHEYVAIPGAPTDDVALFLKTVVLGAAGLGYTQKLAQIQKIALGTLLFIESVRRSGHAIRSAPFGDEFLRGHGLRLISGQSEIAEPDDSSLGFDLVEVALVRSDQHRVRRVQGDGMVEGVEYVMPVPHGQVDRGGIDFGATLGLLRDVQQIGQVFESLRGLEPRQDG